MISMKLVIVGPGAVGKTAACHVFIGKGFPKDILMTIGADFSLRQLNVDGEEVKLQLWDLAGQERFGSVRSMYYLGLSALVLMIDLTRSDTLDVAMRYLQDEIIPCTKDSKIGCVAVVGNKSDLSDNAQISESQLQSLANEVENQMNIRTLCFQTSAKDASSIEDMFTSLVRCTLNVLG
ncbi:MAG: Rab family GTPase [Candidatus Thorarchaeota archaeon]